MGDHAEIAHVKALKPAYRRNRPSITILSGCLTGDGHLAGLRAHAIAVMFWRRNRAGFPIGEAKAMFSLN